MNLLDIGEVLSVIKAFFARRPLHGSVRESAMVTRRAFLKNHGDNSFPRIIFFEFVFYLEADFLGTK